MEGNSFKEQGGPCILCCVLVAQSCSDALGSHRTCSPPGSSVHGIVQARSSWPRDWTHISYVSLRWQVNFFTTSATWEALQEGGDNLLNIYIVITMCCVQHYEIHAITIPALFYRGEKSPARWRNLSGATRLLTGGAHVPQAGWLQSPFSLPLVHAGSKCNREKNHTVN